MWKPTNQPQTPAQPAVPERPTTSTPSAPAMASAESAPRPITTTTADQATIGKSLVIKGEVTGSESLYIDGRVEGSINLSGNRVTVGRNGVGRCQHQRPRDRRPRQSPRQPHRQRSRRHPQRRLADRRRHRRPHLHRGRRLLQGWHRHPQRRTAPAAEGQRRGQVSSGRGAHGRRRPGVSFASTKVWSCFNSGHLQGCPLVFLQQISAAVPAAVAGVAPTLS